MPKRAALLDSIRNDPEVSVLVVGGGINGIGVFRELALQGVDCLLVDKDDFTAGASSKSSRMIHGGLRYLENREFKLVRESLRERNRLLEDAPHCVAPLKTTIPLFSWTAGLVKSPLVFLGLPVKPGGRGALVVKFGLSFYDFVTRKDRRTPTHFLTSRAESLRSLPGINPAIRKTPLLPHIETDGTRSPVSLSSKKTAWYDIRADSRHVYAIGDTTMAKKTLVTSLGFTLVMTVISLGMLTKSLVVAERADFTRGISDLVIWAVMAATWVVTLVLRLRDRKNN